MNGLERGWGGGSTIAAKNAEADEKLTSVDFVISVSILVQSKYTHKKAKK